MGIVGAVIGAVTAIGAAASSFRHRHPEHAPGEEERRRHREAQLAREARLRRIREQKEALEEERRRAEREAQAERARQAAARRQREEEMAAERARQEAARRQQEQWVQAERARQEAERARQEAQRRQREDQLRRQREAQRLEAERVEAERRTHLEAQQLEARRAEQAQLQEAARLEAERSRREQIRVQELGRLEAERRRLENARAEAQRLHERRQAEIARDWPVPPFFQGHEGNVNVGFVGGSGVGKSSLINRILGEKKARVDVKECTVEAHPYSVGRLTLWDLPGAGTDRFPRETYIKQMGLRYFDALVIVTSSRFTQIDSELFREACAWEIPTYLVRTKADLDMESNQHDHRTPPQQTLQQLQQDLHARLAHLNRGQPVSADHVFVVSARKNKFPEELEPEFERLMQNTQARIQKGRGGTL